jgi:hypothetical protein
MQFTHRIAHGARLIECKEVGGALTSEKLADAAPRAAHCCAGLLLLDAIALHEPRNHPVVPRPQKLRHDSVYVAATGLRRGATGMGSGKWALPKRAR